MKKIILISFFVILIITISKAQTRSYGINNFDSIQQTFYQNYTGSGEDTSEGGVFKQFRKWEMFWGPRLISLNNIDSAYAYYKAYVNDFDPTDQVSQIVESDWEEIGPKINGLQGIGRIDAIAFHPTDTNTMYAGSPSGGVWKTTNGGQSWFNLNTDRQLPALGISSIAVDPSNPDTIFLGTGDVDSEWVYSSGIYKTFDGGQSWHEAGLNNWDNHTTIGKVILHPENDSIAFAATSQGIYKTTSRNSQTPSWSKVYPAATNSYEYIRNICFHPQSPDTLYATGVDIVSSTQTGSINTWNRIATSQNGLDFTNTPWPNALGGNEYVTDMNLAIAPQGDFLYVNCVGRDAPPPYRWDSPTYYHVFKYDIENDIWEILTNTGLTYGITAGRTEMAVSPTNSRNVYAGGVYLKVYDPLASPDPRWKSVIFSAHDDYHELAFSPFNDSVMFVGTDGGIYKGIINTGFTNFTTVELNNGLGVATAKNMASSRLDPNQILAGYQDCGISYLKNNNWSHEKTSDGMQCLMDENNINNMYATTYISGNGTIHRSTNDCFNPSWSTIMNKYPPINESAWFGASLVADPSSSKTLYQARLNLWKVDDASSASTSNWYKITDVSALTSPYFGANNCVSYALEIASSDPDYIYFSGVKMDSWATDFDAVRVLKTTVGGGVNPANWTDITPPSPGNSLGTYFVSDIAISSWDPEKVWVTYSGYLEDYKVKYYNGSSWSDYNDGLPNIPVNCIIYVNGSNDALVVGTDVGTYYRDATMSQWEPFMDNLPNVIVSWLELNYTNKKLRASTFGRGLWETDFPSCEKVDDSIRISQDLTWHEPQIITNDLYVESGVDLEIKSTIFFAENTKIIIEPGGKLILNGGMLTNSCGDLWGGIEVWGDPESTQTDANQGVLEIYNYGTIENAETGILVGADAYSDKGGGIVRAYKFNLLNNATAVEFDDYAESTNESYFWEGDFNFTDHLGGTGELSTFMFVDLSNVHHVEFEDCNFTNNSNLDHEGTGIRSSNAIVDVKGHCSAYSGSDCIAWDNTYFVNLEYGIDSRASNTTDYTDVRNTVFTDNYRGIYLSGITNARVTSNKFELNGTAASESYGLYLDECDQYWVEDNHFEKGTTENTHAGIGIYVNESGVQANEIYLNSFDYVEYCVVALGNNRDGRRPETGLVFRCNDYDNTLFDEVVVYDGMLAPPTDDGIAALQGANTLNPEDMAGNLFYYNNTVSGDYDDINNQSNHFYYYYSNNAGNYNVEPLDYTTGTVSIVPKATLLWIYENACPSNLESTGGGGSEGLRSSLSEAQAGIESTEAVLAALIDGGDTEALNTEVENSTPPETSEIYNELMVESPNLSEIVVESSIEKEDVLPNAMIRDVMVANPHTSTSLQLLERLDERTNPMPAWMKAQILAGRSIQSLKTELEGELATYRLQKARAINGLANLYKSDPEITNVNDSLLALYQADNSLHSRYMQAWLYLQDGQFQQGINLMDAIPSNHTLAGYELTTYQNMNLLYTMVAGLMETGNGTDSLNPAQIAQLHIIAGSETGFASVYARNLLLALHELDYQEPVTLPNNMKSTVAEAAYQEMLNAQSPSMLEVYPNPSKDFVIIGYQVNEESPAAIEIRDVSGKLLKTLNVRGHTDQVTVNTHNWKAGVYMLSLIVNEQLIETTKFTLVK